MKSFEQVVPRSHFSAVFSLNRFDAFALIATIVWLVSLTSSTMASATIPWHYGQLPFLLPIGSAIVAAAVAAGVSLGRRRLRLKYVLILFVILGVGVAIQNFAGQWVTPTVEDSSAFYPGNVEPDSQNWDLLLNSLIGAVGGFFGAWLMTWLLFVLPKKLTFVNRFFSYISTNRLRILIGLAIVLFVITTVRNVLDVQGYFEGGPGRRARSKNPSEFTSDAMRIFGSLFVVATVILLTGFAAMSRWKFSTRIVVLGVLAGIACAIVFPLTLTVGKRFNPVTILQLLTIPVVAFVYGIGLVAVSSNEYARPRESKVVDRMLPSIWSFLLIVPVTVVLGVFLYRHDPAFLLVDNSRRKGSNALASARLARSMSNATNGTVTLSPISSGGPCWTIKIQGEQDRDVLATKLDFNISPYVSIRNIQPFVDTSLLINASPATSNRPPLGVWISGGKVTSKQLGELSQAASWFQILGGVELPETCDPGVSLVRHLTIASPKHMPIAKFLDSHIKAPGQRIFLNIPVEMDDWDAIVRASKFRPIQFAGTVPKEVWTRDYPAGTSFENITLLRYGAAQTDPIKQHKFIDLALRYGINVNGLLTKQQIWDLAFATKSKPSGLDLSEFKESKDEFVRKIADANWIAKNNEFGQPLEVWLPETSFISSNPDVFGEVITLRLDLRGITNVFPVGSVICESDDFKTLSKLRNLHLPSDVQLDDLDFLGKMPNLKLLQIQSQDRTLQGQAGFEQCKLLEQLIMFGAPADARTMSEIGKLKNLKSFTIVDDGLSFQTEEEIDAVRQKLPGVEIRIVASEDYVPTLSDAYKKHIAKIVERIKAGVETAKREGAKE